MELLQSYITVTVPCSIKRKTATAEASGHRRRSKRQRLRIDPAAQGLDPSPDMVISHVTDEELSVELPRGAPTPLSDYPTPPADHLYSDGTKLSPLSGEHLEDENTRGFGKHKSENDVEDKNKDKVTHILIEDEDIVTLECLVPADDVRGYDDHAGDNDFEDDARNKDPEDQIREKDEAGEGWEPAEAAPISGQEKDCVPSEGLAPPDDASTSFPERTHSTSAHQLHGISDVPSPSSPNPAETPDTRAAHRNTASPPKPPSPIEALPIGFQDDLKSGAWLHSGTIHHILAEFVPKTLCFHPYPDSRPFMSGKLNGARRVLVPCFNSSHWFLLDFDLGSGESWSLDSKISHLRPQTVIQIASNTEKNLSLFADIKDPFRFRMCGAASNLPQQDNSDDCGVFLVAFALAISAGVSVSQPCNAHLWRIALAAYFSTAGAEELDGQLRDGVRGYRQTCKATADADQAIGGMMTTDCVKSLLKSIRLLDDLALKVCQMGSLVDKLTKRATESIRTRRECILARQTDAPKVPLLNNLINAYQASLAEDDTKGFRNLSKLQADVKLLNDHVQNKITSDLRTVQKFETVIPRLERLSHVIGALTPVLSTMRKNTLHRVHELRARSKVELQRESDELTRRWQALRQQEKEIAEKKRQDGALDKLVEGLGATEVAET